MYMIALVWCLCRDGELADHPFQATLSLSWPLTLTNYDSVPHPTPVAFSVLGIATCGRNQTLLEGPSCPRVTPSYTAKCNLFCDETL